MRPRLTTTITTNTLARKPIFLFVSMAAALLLVGAALLAPAKGARGKKDTTPPTVEAVAPADGATGVSVATYEFAATFSEDIDLSTINGTTFTLTKQGGTTLMQGVVDYDATTKTAWLHRSGDLQPNTTYLATVKGGTNGVKDLAGNPLAADKSWSFTTAEDTNTAPTATIKKPTSATTWAVGDVIDFSGSATDQEDGELSASKLSWEVIMHHCSDISCTNSHQHWIEGFAGVASGQFTAPDHDYPVYMEFRLTATDSGDLTLTDSVYLYPKTVELSFRSEPSGLELAFGGDSKVTPFERTVIVGSNNSIDAPSPQSLGGVDYEFLSWSDGGAQSHNIIAGEQPATYTATYQQPMTGGLKAEYDDDAAYGGGKDFDILHTTRIDPSVDFSWGTQSPAAGMGADDFAVKWSGEVYVPEAGHTTFYVASNDGHRLYIDDILRLDNWKAGNFTGSGEKSVTLDLSAGWHRIEVWHFEGVNNAATKLSYDPAGAEVKQVIPSNRLRSNA